MKSYIYNLENYIPVLEIISDEFCQAIDYFADHYDDEEFGITIYPAFGFGNGLKDNCKYETINLGKNINCYDVITYEEVGVHAIDDIDNIIR